MKAPQTGEEEDPSLFVCEGEGKDNARPDVGDVSILRSAALLEQRCAEVFMSRRVAIRFDKRTIGLVTMDTSPVRQGSLLVARMVGSRREQREVRCEYYVIVCSL
ncbi:hypothetical protein EMWEY_00027440 [Eimeria maxima]|uniref:Uncharacterized protein n=1 Tax=Eimeria maxima TaxID=5804 RepID=U6MCC8_EIMMA|nr:hypothetical protein EMWEY_00027440 [Eimeria maxima]CDJ60094.1 hypothetical protein EMWEY_00027440 [Eimeria maxima]